MRILYYSAHPYLNLSALSGPGTHMRKVIGAFREQEHEVVTCILGGEHLYGTLGITLTNSGLKYKFKSIIPALAWQSLKDIQFIRHDKKAERILEEQIRIYKPDLIYERGFYMMCSGVNASKKAGIPHILEMNAPYPEEKIELEGKSLLLKISKSREKIQVESTSMMVVVSSALRDYYEKKYPSIKGKILITPNAIDPTDFQKAKFNTEAAKMKLELKPTNQVIGFVGSIFPYHGVDRLLEAFAEICEEKNLNDARLLIVGDGEILQQLKDRSKTLGIAQKVIFTGNVPSHEVQQYIAAMDITVLANSKWYCSPIKIFEYGAMGKAVISINTIAVRDVMQNDKTGLLIDNIVELKTAILSLLQDEEKLKKLAKNWEQQVFDKHTWSAVGKNILHFFHSLNQHK